MNAPDRSGIIAADASGATMRRRAMLALAIGMALVLLLLAAIFLRQGTFSRNATLYFTTQSANGLAPGTAVKLNGFRIGAISALQLEPDFSVKVTLRIPYDDFARLRKDAKAALKKEDMVQPATLEINPGSDSEGLSASDPRIAFDRGRSLGQSAQDLTDQLAPILADVKALTGVLSDRERGLGPLLAEWHAASRDLAAAATEIRALSSEARGRMARVGDQAQGTLARLDRITGTAEQNMAKIDAALPGLLLKLDGTLDTAQAVVNDARAISSAASESIPRTLRDLQPAAQDAREIIRGVKQSWPIRNMLPDK